MIIEIRNLMQAINSQKSELNHRKNVETRKKRGKTYDERRLFYLTMPWILVGFDFFFLFSFSTLFDGIHLFLWWHFDGRISTKIVLVLVLALSLSLSVSEKTVALDSGKESILEYLTNWN